MKDLVEKIYDVLVKVNPNDFRGLSLDAQGEKTIKIAKLIKGIKENDKTS